MVEEWKKMRRSEEMMRELGRREEKKRERTRKGMNTQKKLNHEMINEKGKLLTKQRTKIRKRSSRKKKKYLIIAFAVILLLVSTVGGVLLSKAPEKQTSVSTHKASVTQQPTSVPTVFEPKGKELTKAEQGVITEQVKPALEKLTPCKLISEED